MRDGVQWISNSLWPFLKKSVVRFRFVFLLLAAAIFLCLRIHPPEEAPAKIVFFIGRFHPLLIHFPVVLAVLALIFEVLRRLKVWSISMATVLFILLAGLGAALVSVAMGLMLYATGEYTGDLVHRHLLGAVVFTSALCVCIFLQLSFYRSGSGIVYASFVSFLVFANLTLAYTSHQGGSLTHGSEYLTEYMPTFGPEVAWTAKPPEQMLVFDDVILPILDRKCLTCHNENKAKGDLIMTSYKDLLKGGKGERPALKPGSVEESEIHRRAILPIKDEDRMPPEGKIGLTEEEIALLAWWIQKGGTPEMKVLQAEADTVIAPVMKNMVAEIESRQRTRQMREQNLQKLIQTVSKDNYVLAPDPYDDQGITLTMSFPASSFTDNDLLNIEPVFDRITKASFIGSDISDDALYHIANMSSLQELYLQQTKIKGTGLLHLSKLKNLVLLDLSKSEVTDAQLLNILHLPALKDVYIYETTISPEVLKALKDNRPAMQIHRERGKLF
jgi:uncharacterized membrane protein